MKLRIALIATTVCSTLAILSVSQSNAAAPLSESSKVDYAPATAAIAALQSGLSGAPGEEWKSGLLFESALELCSSAGAMLKLATIEEDQDSANKVLEMAAWYLDTIALHLDGQAGESADAHEDDWIENATLVSSLHGLAVEARTEVFRARSSE
jgi:hypothetical protein